MNKNKPIHLAVLVASPPKGFNLLDKLPMGYRFLQKSRRDMIHPLRVIVSDDSDNEGYTFRHVSISRETSLPTYEELKLAKELFVGKQAQAYQIFPPQTQHVNLHENCLHLWAVIGDDPFLEND